MRSIVSHLSPLNIVAVTAAATDNGKICHVVGVEGGGASSYYRHFSFCTPSTTCDPAQLYGFQQYGTPFGLLSNNTGCAAIDGPYPQVPCDGTLYFNQQGSGGVHEYRCICDNDSSRCPSDSQTAQSIIQGTSTILSAVPSTIDPFNLVNYTATTATATSLFSTSTGSSSTASPISTSPPSSQAWKRSSLNDLVMYSAVLLAISSCIAF